MLIGSRFAFSFAQFIEGEELIAATSNESPT
jgi:hypothetical protein